MKVRRAPLRVVVLVLGLAPAGWAQDAVRTSNATPPLGLREAIAESLAASPRLRPVSEQLESATIQQALAASRFGLKVTPQVTTGRDPYALTQRTLGVAVSRQLPVGTQLQVTANTYEYGTSPNDVRDAGYGFTVTQPMLRGFGPATTAELVSARRAVDGSTRSLEDARQQLVVTTTAAYLNALRQERLVEASERALERATKLNAMSEARARVGLATQLDVLRADLLASQAESALTDQRAARADALDELKLLLGRAPESSLELSLEDLTEDGLAAAGLAPDLGDVPAGGAGDFVAVALGARLDVQEAHARIRDALLGVSVAKWNLFPQVDLTVGYTRRGLGMQSSPVFSELLTGWRYGVSTTYALDRSQENAGYASAQIGLRSAQQAALELQSRAEVEVRRAYRAWLRAAQTIAIQEKAMNLAQQQLQIAQLRYERGLAGNFDVVDAEAGVLQSQSALIGAQVERAMAGLTLKRATGTLHSARFVNGGTP
jgi:outer membrane protein